MRVLSRCLLQYLCCQQQGWAAAWPDDQAGLLCSAVTWSHPSNACTLRRSLYAADSYLNGHKNALVPGAGLVCELCLGSGRTEKYFTTCLFLSRWAWSEPKRKRFI